MRLGILLSGGKDSILASHIAQQFGHELACTVTIESQNKESYMFHTPNISITKLQSKAMNLPQILIQTKGEKEQELKELEQAIKQAKEQYNIEGIVTGAVGSTYQASRIQKICHELDLWCFNPLWQMNQLELLKTLLQNNFEVIISGVFAYPFEENWLGKTIDKQTIEQLKELQQKYQINPAGEGGEIETTVLDCPLFLEKIEITKSSNTYDNYSGTYNIEDVEIKEKNQEEQKLQLKQFENNNNPDISILSTVKHKLHELEFIRPITDIIEEENKTYEIITDINQAKGDKIIISGTALKDNDYFDRDVNTNKPILGICAGAQLLAKANNQELKQELKIGMHNVQGKEQYFLHQQSTQQEITEYNNATSVMYHPEVSEKDLIREFIHE